MQRDLFDASSVFAMNTDITFCCSAFVAG